MAAESRIGTLDLRSPPPPGFLEEVGSELGLDKLVGFGQALGAKPGLQGQTVAGSSPVF